MPIFTTKATYEKNLQPKKSIQFPPIATGAAIA
jgi:hypothetical protein